jgi:hypothetical protein
VTDDPLPRRTFRVLTRRRDAYDGALMVDIQLQVIATGALLWSQTFSDANQAEAFQADVERDLDELDYAAFCRRYGIPSSP